MPSEVQLQGELDIARTLGAGDLPEEAGPNAARSYDRTRHGGVRGVQNRRVGYVDGLSTNLQVGLFVEDEALRQAEICRMKPRSSNRSDATVPERADGRGRVRVGIEPLIP